jgi:hypothetical protein
VKRYVTHYETTREGALCGEANAVESSAMREHVTCKRCLRLLAAGESAGTYLWQRASGVFFHDRKRGWVRVPE